MAGGASPLPAATQNTRLRTPTADVNARSQPPTTGPCWDRGRLARYAVAVAVAVPCRRSSRPNPSRRHPLPPLHRRLVLSVSASVSILIHDASGMRTPGRRADPRQTTAAARMEADRCQTARGTACVVWAEHDGARDGGRSHLAGPDVRRQRSRLRALATQEPSFAGQCGDGAVTLGLRSTRAHSRWPSASRPCTRCPGPLGVRRVRWASIRMCGSDGSPHDRHPRWPAPPVSMVRARKTIRRGDHATVPGRWTTGQYVAISGRCSWMAGGVKCRAADVQATGRPSTCCHGRQCWQARARGGGVLPADRDLAVYPVFRLLGWQSTAPGAALGDTRWEIAFLACQIGLFTTSSGP